MIALVDLDEGTRFLADLVDIDPESVELGMPVHTTFREYDGMRLPVFVASASQE